MKDATLFTRNIFGSLLLTLNQRRFFLDRVGGPPLPSRWPSPWNDWPIDAAIARGVYCLVDWHDHHAEQHAEQACAFFAALALTLTLTLT